MPGNFLPLLSNAMKVLYINGKNNVLHDAACCFGEMRPGQKNSPRMPLSRMPFGLIAHNLRFFASDDARKLEAPVDYKSWYQSMYTLLGNKWAALHNGPMWSYIDGEDDKSQASQMVPNSMSNSTCSTDILTEALQRTFGNDCRELLQTTSTCTPGQIMEFDNVEWEEPSLTDVVALTENLPSSSERPSPADAAELVNVTPEEPHPLSRSRNPQSYLWASLSESQRSEQEGASLTPSDLEEIHGIRPSNVANTSNRDRNPLNVRRMLLYDVLFSTCLYNRLSPIPLCPALNLNIPPEFFYIKCYLY